MANFYIGDLHFGHKNCLAFDNRPFNTIEDHDERFLRDCRNLSWEEEEEPSDE